MFTFLSIQSDKNKNLKHSLFYKLTDVAGNSGETKSDHLFAEKKKIRVY